MGSNDVGERYARALFEVTEERKESDKAALALQAMVGALDHSRDLRHVLLDPRMRHDRMRVFEALAEKAQAPTAVVSLLRTLDAQERLAELPAVTAAFVRHVDAHAGRVRGNVLSAFALGEAEQKTLARSVGDSIGKHVTLDFTVDPALVGGVVVKVGDLVWDGSVRTQLDRMRQALR